LLWLIYSEDLALLCHKVKIGFDCLPCCLSFRGWNLHACTYDKGHSFDDIESLDRVVLQLGKEILVTLSNKDCFALQQAATIEVDGIDDVAFSCKNELVLAGSVQFSVFLLEVPHLYKLV
jgi:hypothetical protein